ncbi:MAG: flavin reductase family protein [Clostridia bacterium]|nr:flavin reductase family protein [Clostridia bacterium]
MARQDFKPSTMLSPVPAVMVSCGTMEKPNIITIAWTGTINSDPAMAYISVRRERFSHKLIKDSGEFVINLTTANTCRATDFCGVRSGTSVDKFKKCNLTPIKSKTLSAPSIAQSPLSIECKVKEIIPLGSHDMFIGEVKNISVDENYIDEKGRIRFDKFKLISYAHGQYFQLGKSLGHFGFSVKKNSTKKRQREERK